MSEAVTHVFLLALPLLAMVVTWMIFGLFISFYERRSLSAFGYFIKRLFSTLVVGVLAIMFNPAYIEMQANNKKFDDSNININPTTIRTVPPASPMISIDQTSRKTSETLVERSSLPIPITEYKESNTSAEAKEKSSTTSETLGTTSSSQPTEEQVQDLEREKGYSGNDPIVRKRLGLPPKR